MSATKSVIFLGSKPVGYQCLQHLIAVSATLNLTIEGVLTQARQEFEGQSNVAALATEAGIPVLATTSDIPDCDILYSVQYHKILSKEEIAKAQKVAVNLHMAPLPEYRGSNQFSYAIIDDRNEFGVTVHVIDERIDHGDILFQKRFPVPDACWIDQLYSLTESNAVALFKETLQDIITGNFSPKPQSDLERLQGSTLHFKDEIKRLKQIDLSWDKEKIERHIRATSMPGFEPPYAVVGGRKIHFSTGE